MTAVIVLHSHGDGHGSPKYQVAAIGSRFLKRPQDGAVNKNRIPLLTTTALPTAQSEYQLTRPCAAH
jgi:hypothetical protein